VYVLEQEMPLEEFHEWALIFKWEAEAQLKQRREMELKSKRRR
jgi:hypothetical protein